MRFQPKSKEELATSLWPKGEYDCEVIDALDHVSKSSGNQGIKLVVRVFNTAGDTIIVYDYLMATEKALFKTLQFCEATGLMPVYEQGELTPEDCLQRGCRVKLKTESRTGYDDANKIDAYLPPKTGWQEQPAASAPKETPRRSKSLASPSDPGDDDIPF